MKNIILVCFAIAMMGCAADVQYQCTYPKGIGCMPVDEVYKKSVNGELRDRRYKLETDIDGEGEKKNVAEDNDEPDDEWGFSNEGTDEGADAGPSMARYNNKGYPFVVRPGNPIRQAPRILRAWISNWEDGQGDYHDSSYVYIVIDHGRWIYRENQKHTEESIQENYYD